VSAPSVSAAGKARNAAVSHSDADYDSYRIGDRVYCLAWVGLPFDVVAKDDERRVIGIETPPGWPTFAQVDVFPENMFLLTHEHWDFIWYWPDRAGELYYDVFQRFCGRHQVGEVICGYHVPDGLMVTLGGMKVALDPRRTMMFRIQAIDVGRGQVRVHPVAAVGAGGALVSTPNAAIADEAWQRSGPTVAIRLEMRLYRWCLTFGELVLNWEDL
jgi:hypothetical protein